MSDEHKRKILVCPDLTSDQLREFFQNMGFELCHDVEEGFSYEFIVNDYLPDIEGLPRLFTNDLKAFEKSFKANSCFDERFIKHDLVSYVLQAGLSNTPDYDLLGRFSKEAKNVFTIKVQDYLNIGYFVDQIVLEAYKNEFPVEGMRDYLNSTLQYIFSHLKRVQGYNAVEVSYCYSTSGFALDMAFSLSDFKIDKEEGLFERLYLDVNCFILNYNRRRNRIQISALWFKDPKLSDFHSCFITETVGKRHRYGDLPEFSNQLDETGSPVEYNPTPVDPAEASRLNLARKFAQFIKQYRLSEDDPKDVLGLTIEDVDVYLSKHSIPQLAQKLDEDLKKLILHFLRDESLEQGVSDYVENHLSANLEVIMEDFQKVIGGKSLDELMTVVRVSGMPEKYEEGFMRVKAWSESTNEEQWAIKRLDLIEAIKNEVARIKASGEPLSDDDLARVVGEELGLDPVDVKFIIKALFEEIATAKTLKREQIEEDSVITMRSNAEVVDPEKLIEQVVRMKRLIDQLRGENYKFREDNKYLRAQKVGYEVEKENDELRKALTKALEQIRNKDDLYIKTKNSMEKTIESKDVTIKKFEDRILTLSDLLSKAKAANHQESVERLKIENKNLSTKLELVQGKLNIISENMGKQKASDGAKRENLIKNFAAEKSLLEEKLKAERLEGRKAEYRLRNALAQIEELQKNQITSPQNEKTLDYYVRQVEGLNIRIKEAGEEIAEKKKEIHKLKHEISTLMSKNMELEKKLFVLEKKAS